MARGVLLRDLHSPSCCWALRSPSLAGGRPVHLRPAAASRAGRFVPRDTPVAAAGCHGFGAASCANSRLRGVVRVVGVLGLGTALSGACDAGTRSRLGGGVPALVWASFLGEGRYGFRSRGERPGPGGGS